MERYGNSKPQSVSENTTGVDAVGHPVAPSSGSKNQGHFVADTISRSSSERTIMSSGMHVSESVDENREEVESSSVWIEFGTWLKNHQSASSDDEQDGEDTSVEVQVHQGRSVSFGADEAVEDMTQHSEPTPGKGPVMIPKDCRMESSLLAGVSGGPVRGLQEMSIMLGAPGIPAIQCPVIPTKAIGNIVTALYEPLVTLEVGVLTRTLESPMLLKPRNNVRHGTLSLYILPDDSLSLTFEGHVENVEKKNSSVLDILNHGMSHVQNIKYADVQASMWEELARFPRWREQTDKAIVTVHMLKGDKSGRSFYVLAGEGTNPPGFPLSCNGQKRFDEFRSVTVPQESQNRRYYFWMTSPNVEDDVHALGRIKSYIKHPPSLAKIAGVPQTLLESLSSWAERIDQIQREQLDVSNDGDSPDIVTNPLDAVGAVLSRRVPTIATNSSFVNSDGSVIESLAAVTANANAVFKDNKFDVSCPCSVSVSCALVLRGQVGCPGDNREQCEKEMTFAASSEGRCLSEDLARSIVEAIGKARIQEWICEDLVHNTRKQRLRFKAERQRKRDLEKGYLALRTAESMIQKAVASANLGRKLNDGELQSIENKKSMKNKDTHSPSPSEHNEEVMLDDASMKSVSQDIGTVVHNQEKVEDNDDGASSSDASSSRKISIHDLNKLFGK